ncbi:hypothetical protein NDU88_000537 [Pleurodeles waltl]|uniref:SMB domain-containing protein n=1 Tax=Pleurodeles waltl TaxID=8319 RepID=A0AAV7L6U5_PLEWA|nr:hypothetical protein NDU88_000537 [Pleurodeles waltl]
MGATGRCSLSPPLCCLGKNDTCMRRDCYCDEYCSRKVPPDCCSDYNGTCNRERTTQASRTTSTRISPNGTTTGITPTTRNDLPVTTHTTNTGTSKPRTANTSTATRISTSEQSTRSNTPLGTSTQLNSGSTSKGNITTSSQGMEIVSTATITTSAITPANTPIGGHNTGSNLELETLTQLKSESTSKGIITTSSRGTEIVSTSSITADEIKAASTPIGGNTTGSNLALGTLTQVKSGFTSKGVTTHTSLSTEIVRTAAITIHHITAATTTIGEHTHDSSFATETTTQWGGGSISIDFTTIAGLGMETESTTAMATGKTPGGSTTEQSWLISKSTSTPSKVESNSSAFSTNSRTSMETASTTAIVISPITTSSTPPSEPTVGQSWESLPSTQAKDGSFSNYFTEISGNSMNAVTSPVIAIDSYTPTSTAVKGTTAVQGMAAATPTEGKDGAMSSSITANPVLSMEAVSTTAAVIKAITVAGVVKDAPTIKDASTNFSLSMETGNISLIAIDNITAASTRGRKTTTGHSLEGLKSTGSSLAVEPSTQEKSGVSNNVFTKDSGLDMVITTTTGKALVSFAASGTQSKESTTEQNTAARTSTQVKGESPHNGFTTNSGLNIKTGSTTIVMINTSTVASTPASESSTGQRWESLKSTDIGILEGIQTQSKGTFSSTGYTIDFGNLKPATTTDMASNTTPRAHHSTALGQVSTGVFIKGITSLSSVSRTELLTLTTVNDLLSIHPSEGATIKAFDPIAVTEHGPNSLINSTTSPRITALVNGTSKKETILSNHTHKSVTAPPDGGTSMVESRTETLRHSITSASAKAKDEGRTYPVTETTPSNTSIETTTHRADTITPLHQITPGTNAIKTNENTTSTQDSSISMQTFSKLNEDITTIKSSTTRDSNTSTEAKVTSGNSGNLRTTESITAGTTLNNTAQLISEHAVDSTALESTSANDNVIHNTMKSSLEDKMSTNASQFTPATAKLSASAVTSSSNVTNVEASKSTTAKISFNTIANTSLGYTLNIKTFKSTSTNGIMVKTTTRRPVATTTPGNITTIAYNILPVDFLNSRSFENPNTEEIKALTTRPTGSLSSSIGTETVSARVTNSTIEQLSQNNIIKNRTTKITAPFQMTSRGTPESISNAKSMVTSTNTTAFKQVSRENQVATRVVITSRSSMTGDTTALRKGSTTTVPAEKQRDLTEITSTGRTLHPSTRGTDETHIHVSLGVSTLLNLTDAAVRERILQQLNQLMRKWFSDSNMTLTWKRGRVK